MTTKKIYNYKTPWGFTAKVRIAIDKYVHDDALALRLVDAEDGSSFGIITTYLENTNPKQNHAFIKTWSENEGVEDFIVQNEIGRPTGRVVRSGFVISPEYDFTSLMAEEFV